MCDKYKGNSPPMRAKWLCLAHCCSLHGGNPYDFLYEPLIATIYQVNAEQSSSRGLCESDQHRCDLRRKDVDDGFRVVEWDVAHHHPPLHECALTHTHWLTNCFLVSVPSDYYIRRLCGSSLFPHFTILGQHLSIPSDCCAVNK